MKPVFIFDVGGVLVDWNPRHLYRKIFSSEKEMEYFLTEVCPPAWNETLDAGRPFKEACDEKIAKYPQYKEAIDAYRTRWQEMISGPVAGTAQIVQELKEKGYALYALSNFSAETFPPTKKRFDVFSLFDGIVLSGEEKINKPDSEIYRRLLNRYGLKAENCLFIDDNLDNIRAAEKLGFQTIHFIGAEKLRRMLVSGGCL